MSGGPGSGVLITGSHRSGTTWVGRMLSLDERLSYVGEPFNIVRLPSWIAPRLPHQYLYVCPENEDAYLEAVGRVVALRHPLLRELPAAARAGRVRVLAREWRRARRHRSQGRIPLVKDPIALFSTPWLVERFGLVPVVMIRHPLAFAGSLKRLNWAFDFRHWLDQPLLMRDLLEPFADDLHAAAGDRDIIDQAILQWRVMYAVVHRFRLEHPDWMFIRHEDLSVDPLEGFADLYARLGLSWDAQVAARIIAATGEDNVKEVSDTDAMRIERDSRAAVHTWQHRLTDAEAERVVLGTQDVAVHFYEEHSPWTNRTA